MSQNQLRITPTAYLTVLLHTFKNPSTSALGVLLARPDAPTTVTHAVPVTHLPLARAAATLDIACGMLSAWIAEDGWVAAGVYVALDTPVALTPATVASFSALDGNITSLARQILSGLGNADKTAPIVLLDANLLADASAPPVALVPLVPGLTVTLHGAPSSLARTGTALQLADSLYDLDDHFEDAARDWIGNSAVISELSKLVA
ncbi:hypothetical protein BC828DRAFT_386846 [Blastocladiella britannica]|nr:hypothetical protein BC828DRAFT_386846 [Blastocladiella britannica]